MEGNQPEWTSNIGADGCAPLKFTDTIQSAEEHLDILIIQMDDSDFTNLQETQELVRVRRD